MDKTKLNPKTVKKEFYGVYGVLFLSIVLPIILFFFELVLRKPDPLYDFKFNIKDISEKLSYTIRYVKSLIFEKEIWIFYNFWFFGLILMDYLIPGKIVNGSKLRNGSTLKYKINGFNFFITICIILVIRLLLSKNFYLYELDYIYKNQAQLIMTTILFSYLLATFCYLYSFIPLSVFNKKNKSERLLSLCGNSKNIIYDWFLGRELNPRFFDFDIKLFCEFKPGLLLWLLINLSCLHYQYHEMKKISNSLILVNVFQGYYIYAGLKNEIGCLNMMDITTDGFGFMLAFGDLSWVPWLYSIQSRFLCLSKNFYELSYIQIISIIILNFIGVFIFNSSNKQKSEFKKGNLNHLKTIQTIKGNLLCDGWWKVSQHINYFGDWIIGWSWCLTTGFKSPITYFYVLYFSILLLHRQLRDEEKCLKKYGQKWIDYQKEVPYKIIPYVY